MDERPIPARDIHADVVLPAGFRATSVEVMTPEQPAPKPVEITQNDKRVKFRVPEFLVYAVARVKLQRTK